MASQKKRKSVGFQGQLTGISRQIKDSVADINNFVVKWENLNSTGIAQLEKITSAKLSLLGSNAQAKQNGVTVLPCYSHDLENAANDLFDTINQFHVIVTKLNSIVTKFKTLTQLDSSFSNSSDSSTSVLSRPVSWYEDYATSIAAMHAKELQVKQNIAENVAHVEHFILNASSLDDLCYKSRDVLIMYSSCWVHQPYINERVRSTMIAEMLRDTGHQ